MFLSKTPDFRGGGYRFFMFQMWLSGVLLRRSVEPSYLDNFHCSWIVNGVIGHYGNDYTKTLLARHLYSGQFQNAIECCMRCNMCSVDTNLSYFTECPCCIAQSTWVIGHHSGVSSKINIHQLNVYPCMCTLMVSLYFTHQIISYGTIPRWRQGTQRGHQLFLVSVLRSTL